ncbi:MAG: hypothetical protein ACREBC_37295, partial [Pyrinomonadaceae bacterium]
RPDGVADLIEEPDCRRAEARSGACSHRVSLRRGARLFAKLLSISRTFPASPTPPPRYNTVPFRPASIPYGPAVYPRGKQETNPVLSA